MKNSKIYVVINLGPVLDETVMSPTEVKELLECRDLNEMDITPLTHILTDLDTGDVVRVEDLETGLVTHERYN
jgi:hypothetical protein